MFDFNHSDSRLAVSGSFADANPWSYWNRRNILQIRQPGDDLSAHGSADDGIGANRRRENEPPLDFNRVSSHLSMSVRLCSLCSLVQAVLHPRKSGYFPGKSSRPYSVLFLDL